MKEFSAVIIASGKASRLGDICKDKPKCMICFDEVPFIRYLLSWLLKSGIDDIVVTGSRSQNGYQIEEEVKSNFPSSVQVVLEDYPKSTVNSTYVGVSSVKKSQILLLTGDNVWDVGVRSVCNFHLEKESKCTMLLTTSKDVPNYGLVKVEKDTGRVLSFWDVNNDIPGLPASTMGFYILDREELLNVLSLGRDLHVERESFQRLIPNVWGIINNNFFFDFGTPDNLKFLQRNTSLIKKCFGNPEKCLL